MKGISIYCVQSIIVSDLFSKYARVVPIKDRKGTSIVNAFQKIISEGKKQIKYGLIKAVNFTIILLKIFEK